MADSIADLYASLGLDSTQFSSDLSKAQVDFMSAADVIQGGTSRINDTFKALNDVLGEVAANALLRDMSSQSLDLNANLNKVSDAFQRLAQTQQDGYEADQAAASVRSKYMEDYLGDLVNAEREQKALNEAVKKLPADTAIPDMVGQLTLLAEALAVTELIKDFGQASLVAFGSLERSDIALTALTGSATNAAVSLNLLKSLSITDALSFPALVDANQRLTAFGFSAAQIPATLEAIANAAGATNRSFDSTANSLERIAISGTLMSRQLATVGLSMEDIAKVIGVSAANVTASFKLLDQDTRLEALAEALQKYGDVAAKVADGLVGQWQRVQNQILFVLQSTGDALAPVAEQLLGIVSSDVLPFLQNLVDGFNQLSPSVKDFVVGMGIATAALVPIVAGLAAFGLAANGLAAITPILTGLFEALGASVIITSPLLIPIAVGITAIGYALSNTNKSLDSWSQTFKDDFTGLSDFISPVTDKLKGIASAYADIYTNLAKIVGNAILPQWTQDLVTNTAAWATNVFTIDNYNAGLEYVTGHVTDLRNTLTTLNETNLILTTSTDGVTTAIRKTPAEILAAKMAAAEAAAAFQSMSDAAVSLYNSSVKLFAGSGDSYQTYIDKLSEGGRSAQSSLAAIEAAIIKTTEGIANSWGQPKQDLVDMLGMLNVLQQKEQAFADNDAFTKTAVKIDALTDKYREQVAEIELADPTMVSFFNDMADRATNAGQALDKFDLSKYVQKWLEGLKQLDDVLSKSNPQWETANTQYNDSVLKSIGLTAAFKTQLVGMGPIWASMVADLFNPVAIGPPAMTVAYDESQKLAAALKVLGVSADDSGGKLIKAFDDVATDSQKTLPEVEDSFAKISVRLTRLAAFDLPLAVTQWGIYRQALVDLDAPEGQILAALEKQLVLQASVAEQTHQYASTAPLELAMVQRAIADDKTATDLLATAYTGMWKAFDNGINAAASGIAGLIVTGGKFGDIMMGVLNKIETEILTVLIGTVLKALTTALLVDTGIIASINNGILAAAVALGATPAFDAAKSLVFDPATGVSAIGGAGTTSAAAAQTAALTANTAAITAQTTAIAAQTAATVPVTPALVANTAATVPDTAATAAAAAAAIPMAAALYIVAGELPPIAALLAAGNVIQATMEGIDSALLPITEQEAIAEQSLAVVTGTEAAATVADTTATVADVAATTGDVVATTADVAATVADTVATAADTIATTADTAAEIADTASDIADTAAEIANTAAVVADTAATTAGAASGLAGAAGSALSGVSSLASGGLLGAGIDAAAGIVQGFQMARLINLTGEIEKSTRYCMNQLIATQLTDDQYLPELTHLVDIWSQLIVLTDAVINSGLAARKPGSGPDSASAENIPDPGSFTPMLVQVADSSGNVIDPSTDAPASSTDIVSLHNALTTSSVTSRLVGDVAPSSDTTAVIYQAQAIRDLTSLIPASQYYQGSQDGGAPKLVAATVQAIMQSALSPDQIASAPVNGAPAPPGTAIIPPPSTYVDAAGLIQQSTPLGPSTYQQNNPTKFLSDAQGNPSGPQFGPAPIDTAAIQAANDKAQRQYTVDMQAYTVAQAAAAAATAGTAATVKDYTDAQTQASLKLDTRILYQKGGTTISADPNADVTYDMLVAALNLAQLMQAPKRAYSQPQSLPEFHTYNTGIPMPLSDTTFMDQYNKVHSGGFDSLSSALSYIPSGSTTSGTAGIGGSVVPVTIISNQSPDALARATALGLRQRGVRII